MQPAAAAAMQLHGIGQQLRAVVLRDQQLGRGLDPRRLQAVIADLCADGAADLIAPLRHLVLSEAFARAASTEPPLADGRQLTHLRSELAPIFAAPLCQRLEPVLEGLLALPESSRAVSAPAAQAPPGLGNPGQADASTVSGQVAAGQSASSQAPAGQGLGAGTAPQGSGCRNALVVLLAGLSGALAIALVGVALLLWQRLSSQPAAGGGTSPPAVANTSAVPAPAPLPAASGGPSQPATSVESPATETNPVSAGDSGLPLDRAVASIQALYGALSAKQFSRAEGLFGAAAADQFTPSFFRQFERVSVQELRSTSQVGSTLNLEGVVTFVWPDGSLQRETRSFSVDTGSTPALITGSEFGQVLSPRR